MRPQMNCFQMDGGARLCGSEDNDPGCFVTTKSYTILCLCSVVVYSPTEVPMESCVGITCYMCLIIVNKLTAVCPFGCPDGCYLVLQSS